LGYTHRDTRRNGREGDIDSRRIEHATSSRMFHASFNVFFTKRFPLITYSLKLVLEPIFDLSSLVQFASTLPAEKASCEGHDAKMQSIHILPFPDLL
jgi:hypothetical protein